VVIGPVLIGQLENLKKERRTAFSRNEFIGMEAKLVFHSMTHIVTAWRCGGILCSFCPQRKPIKGRMFNDYYCCLIYKLQAETADE
jgi:hypothetical protein